MRTGILSWSSKGAIKDGHFTLLDHFIVMRYDEYLKIISVAKIVLRVF